MPQGEIEKNISLFVRQQFPAIYRENGPELVSLVEEYYKFCETQQNQGIYNQRRLFELKDIDTTITSMLIFFKKKFLADLPLKTDILSFIVKNILDMYRSKGTKRGIELFFAIFYQEFDIEIIYPSEKMAKISDSEWRQGVYLQMLPNQNEFLSITNKKYTYFDLLSQNIEGSETKARAAVRSVNFFILNGIKTPVIYLDDIQGTFSRYEDIVSVISGEQINFGRINGSLSSFTVDTSQKGLVGRTVGEILDVKQDNAYAGKVIVTDITNEITGKINYEVIDGGYGYTINNARLLVSNQSIICDNSETGYNQGFIIGETVQDGSGNSGTVIGQNESTVGIRMGTGLAFTGSSTITTVRASGNITVVIGANGNGITEKNETSPGDLYPDTSDVNDVKVTSLKNASVASLIEDVITPHLPTVFNAADYESTAPMSGTASPVNANTALNDAFAITNFTIGEISGFDNVNPGSEYKNDVYARAEDSVMKNFERRNQIIRFQDVAEASGFSIGDIVKEQAGTVRGRVLSVNNDEGAITVVPFDYYGFTGLDIIRSGISTPIYNVTGVSNDYSGTDTYGNNAEINAETEFAIGRVKEVSILSSGFGYVDGYPGQLIDPLDPTGLPVSQGTIGAKTQGVTQGYWAGENSQLAGYKQLSKTSVDSISILSDFATSITAVAVSSSLPSGVALEFENWAESLAPDGFAYGDINSSGSIDSADAVEFTKIVNGENTLLPQSQIRFDNVIEPNFKQQAWYTSMADILYTVTGTSNAYTQEYYDSGSRIQDSDFFQEYSYQIKSSMPLQEYEAVLKENVHLAGSKLFGDFIFKSFVGSDVKTRFLRLFNDQGGGSPLDIADIADLRASITNYTSDSSYVSADHTPGGSGGLTLTASTDLDITKNWSQGFFDYEVTVQMPTSGSAPYPVAILLHGAGGNAAGMIAQNASVLPGHVLVGVDGYNDTWNISNEPSNGPDIEMLNDLITKLKLYNNVDTTKFRIMGFSNGGALALRAAVEITDSAVDVIICGGSQTNDDQYRGGYFFYPADEELTGDAYANDGYNAIKNPIPQRKIVQLNGTLDTVIPYNGGANFTGMTHLSAPNSAYAFAQAQGYSGSQSSGTSYGTNSFLVDYGDVIFLNDAVGHTTSADMRNLVNKYLEDNYSITY